VKLLFDENLSRKLVVRLAELYPESAHVVDFDLIESPDRDIWEFADRTAAKSLMASAPEASDRDAEEVLRREAIRITEFASDPELASWFSIAIDRSSVRGHKPACGD
jgi:hypothetical protein